MSGRDVHGPDWNPDWDDADRFRGSGNIYGVGFWAVVIIAIVLALGVWLFSPPALASEWRVVPAGRCVGPASVAVIFGGEGVRSRALSTGITELRRKGARAMVQLRWRERGRCLDAWRTIEERGA